MRSAVILPHDKVTAEDPHEESDAMSEHASPETACVLADLRELALLTSTPQGAQRVAWGPVWRQARAWFRQRVAALGMTVTTDAAGNGWVTLPGASDRSLLIGSHLDSVPNGGWLDGALGVLAGLEVLRHYRDSRPPLTLHLVDWADEEGRFARSLLGSSAAAGTLEPDRVRDLVDPAGVRLADALAENGVRLENMLAAHGELHARQPQAYLELHIEQGPVLESLNQSTGVVLGTFGVERHTIRFTGQAAHAGSTPIPMRRDAFLAAAEFALECRAIAQRHSQPGAGVVCTVGRVRVEPGITTAVPGVAEITLDQRALDADNLARMLNDAREAADRIAAANRVQVAWTPLFRMTPRLFDPRLIRLGEEAVREVTGDALLLPSGPLHDASEMAALMPTVMLFASSTNGLSHCKEEDTPVAHLDKTIQAFLRLVDKTLRHLTSVPAGT
jgi:N-carbamoyl-L-amino-acid hydrolase